MITVSTLLMAKGYDIYTIDKDATALEALELLAEKNIGALLVTHAKKPVGIFSERDFVRKVAADKKIDTKTHVEKFMTPEVFCVTLTETMDEIMAIMTNKHIRHLPVCDEGQLVGMISIGDVVKQEISDKDLLIDNMEKYILGRGYGE
jgi:CBS domain-containing protein